MVQSTVTKGFVLSGDTLVVTAPRSVSKEDGVLVGFIFGIAQETYASGAYPAYIKPFGVFNIVKKAGDTFSPGDLCYWDNTNFYVTSTASGNKKIGCCHETAAASGDANVQVWLPGQTM